MRLKWQVRQLTRVTHPRDHPEPEVGSHTIHTLINIKKSAFRKYSYALLLVAYKSGVDRLDYALVSTTIW